MPDFPISYGPGFTGAPNFGVNAGASATPNTKGAYVEVVASTAFEADALVVIMCVPDVVTGHLLDIAVGGAGAEQIILADLHVSGSGRSTTTFTFPVSIPAGSRIAARCASGTASSALRVRLMLMRGGLLFPPAGGRIVTMGAVSADSGGTALNAGAVQNTYGAWSELASSTVADIAALQFRTGGAGNAAPAASTCNFFLQVGVGAAAAETPIVDGYAFASQPTGDMGQGPDVWFPAAIPAGSRLAARIRSDTTDATDRIVDLVVYGLVI